MSDFISMSEPWKVFIDARVKLDLGTLTGTITDGYVDACGCILFSGTVDQKGILRGDVFSQYSLVGAEFVGELTPEQQAVMDRTAEGFAECLLD